MSVKVPLAPLIWVTASMPGYTLHFTVLVAEPAVEFFKDLT